ncbi:hypothetical protein CF336_g8600 [Tilletia laevis]|nr:hypothetical protein CF336_g8600 [Tilletia laevis]
MYADSIHSSAPLPAAAPRRARAVEYASEPPATTTATEPHQCRSPQPLGLPQLTTAPDPEPEPDADSARSTPTLAFPPSPDLSSPRGGGLAASLSVPQRPGQNRGRSSSLLKLEHIQDSHDVMLDQNAGFNANADWVNHKAPGSSTSSSSSPARSSSTSSSASPKTSPGHS